MGDRGNILVIAEGSEHRVNLYTHWGGSSLHKVVSAAIINGQRIDDPTYFTRILFSNMLVQGASGEQAILDTLQSAAGFGIGNHPCDGCEWIVDLEKQEVRYNRGFEQDIDTKPVSFQAIRLGEYNLRDLPSDVAMRGDA